MKRWALFRSSDWVGGKFQPASATVESSNVEPDAIPKAYQQVSGDLATTCRRNYRVS